MKREDAILSHANDPEEKCLCSTCVEEPFLKSEIDKTGEIHICSYCNRKNKTLSIEKLADKVEVAIEQHYQRTSPNPSDLDYMRIKELGEWWERDGNSIRDVIADAAKIGEIPAEDIRLVLYDRHFDMDSAEIGEENPFDTEACYIGKEPSDDTFREKWQSFEKSMKTESRFFSRTTLSILDDIFEDLSRHKTRDGHSVIITAGPNGEITELYRTRVFQSQNKLINALMHPDLEIGPPPAIMARAGRMNAPGISVFYGSTDIDTAIAESRPPVGSRVVAARFKIMKPLRLLDVEALRAIEIEGSIFDDKYMRQLERAKFLETLSHSISRPVMPDDEHFEYITTQAIANYFATEVHLDGVIYPSVQAGESGANVVLFHHAAHVEIIPLKEGVALDAHSEIFTEDGPEIDYAVYELTPADGLTDDAKNPKMHFSGSFATAATSTSPTLLLDIGSLGVHHISGIKFSTQRFPVARIKNITSNSLEA